MKQVTLIYDDTLAPPPRICDMLGITSFGSILSRNRPLRDRMLTMGDGKTVGREVCLLNESDKAALASSLLDAAPDAVFLYFPANLFVTDTEKFKTFLAQLNYADKEMVAGQGYGNQMFLLRRDNMRKLMNAQLEGAERECNAELADRLYALGEQDFWSDLYELHNFLTLLSGGTDARHFNRMSSDGRFLRKGSDQVDKIRAEYQYYWLLPESMKPYFVMPFDFEATNSNASYRMERIHAPDMSVQWTYHSLSVPEFEGFLDEVFEFVTLRAAKPAGDGPAEAAANDLYVKKPKKRFEELKALPVFSSLDALVKAATGRGLADINDRYQSLVAKHARTWKKEHVVVGHGDLCFSNILYDKTTRQLKFIDPRGATREEALWTDRYYDMAKLSHSVLGGYDYVNRFLSKIDIDDALKPRLMLEARDTSKHKALFVERVEKAGFELKLVRLYEAGLFLSMLPLHADFPRKLLSFVLIASDILDWYERK